MTVLFTLPAWGGTTISVGYLGEPMDEIDRDDVLQALYAHVLRTVIVSVEAPDGGTVLRVQGTLVPGSRGSGEQTDVFAVISRDVNAQVWFWNAEKRRKYGVADIRATGAFSVPETGIVEFVSDDSSGYRFSLGDGTQIAVTLWNDTLQRTESGDRAPTNGRPRSAVEIRRSPDR